MTLELAELLRLALERALNAALKADPASRAALRGLIGKRIRIELKGLFSLDLRVSDDALVVITGPGLDEPDATLRASPLGFLRARMHGNLMHGDIELTGDSHLAVHAARLLGDLAPDIEMVLTPLIGMLAAHQVSRLWHGIRDELRRFAAHRLRDEADYLREEAELIPHRAELESWFDAVDRMRDRVDALEERIGRLEKSPDRTPRRDITL